MTDPQALADTIREAIVSANQESTKPLLSGEETGEAMKALDSLLARLERTETAGGSGRPAMTDRTELERAYDTLAAFFLRPQFKRLMAVLAGDTQPAYTFPTCPDCGFELEPGETHELHPDAGCVAGREGSSDA